MILPIPSHRAELLPVYVVDLGSYQHQTKMSRPYGLSRYQFLYCLHGSGILEIENEFHRISVGDAFFFRSNIPHKYYPTGENWTVRWVCFDGSNIPNILEYINFGKSEVLHLSDPESYNHLLDSMTNLFWIDDSCMESKLSALMYKLLMMLGEHKNIPNTNENLSENKYYEKLSPVIAMLRERYAQDLSLQDMAAAIDVTSNHLCRLFQQAYGISPSKYLMNLRITMAKQLLCASRTKKIKDIALSVGFKDPSYFCSVFKKMEGVTPDGFRRMNVF